MGGCLFILVLGISAFCEADIRWLHFFQAWMVRCCDGIEPSRESLGIFYRAGCRRPLGLREYFCHHLLFQRIAAAFAMDAHGAFDAAGFSDCRAAWFCNLFVVIGCLWAYARLPRKSLGDVGRFLLAFVLTTVFFALDMALFQPRYLGLFPRMLHPHLP